MPDSTSTSGAVELADTISDLLYSVAGVLSIGFGLLAAAVAIAGLFQEGIAAGTLLLTTLIVFVGFALVSLGLFVSPWFRRRLNRRHAASQFGRVRSVDQRVVRPNENCSERCVACQSRIEKGLVRRYRDEFALAGVPIYTSSEGFNYYCLACATSDELGTTAPVDEPSTSTHDEGEQVPPASERDALSDDDTELAERQ